MADRNSTPLVVMPNDNRMVNLTCPLAMPNACGYLWNSELLVQMNCRGYAIAQFLQPEPSKYSQSPALEAKTFVQPEHPYFAHHPGRFIYVKDENSGEVFSAPHEPCRKKPDEFVFSVGPSEISWTVKRLDLTVFLSVSLPINGAEEIWTMKLKNNSKTVRNISVYPYFSVGYKSWMNQSADYDACLNAIIAKSITPYQKTEEYQKNKKLKDITFLLSKNKPCAWTTISSSFEGEGGLSKPDQIRKAYLSCQRAVYETPVAVMQFQHKLSAKQSIEHQFVFGAVKDQTELSKIRDKYFSHDNNVTNIKQEYEQYISQSFNVLTIDCEDKEFSQFANTWLPRQVFYHGGVNRLTTDPQTRNYLQDNMGLCFIEPAKARSAFLTALAQQSVDGSMPDGILLHPEATLKYINQIPHADHGVWLTIFLQAYLDETNDANLLTHTLPFSDSQTPQTVITHIEKGLARLIAARDHRGLSYIEQGDWCDPMNMVGHKGRGVSSWLSLATAYAINCWCQTAEQYIENYSAEKISDYKRTSHDINNAVNHYLWDGSWYARGITDDDTVFGVKDDDEGRIYLNPQSWALLSGAAGTAKKFSMLNEIERQLNTPFGVMMLAPSYTKMREDIGRLTQKHPGVAENGSVYNHASAFYVYSLYQVGEYNQAFQLLKKMIPTKSDMIKKGQLPVYIPNYYRGAYYQFPEQAGRSSHLFNTGTVAWVYRCIIEELCGLKGYKGHLTVNPKLPDCLDTISGKRQFKGAWYEFTISRHEQQEVQVIQDGNLLNDNVITDAELGNTYVLEIRVPRK
ncbi:GH36-type glycosyl hydrolase domain-containing protein [Thalassotalea atypica]|uniref:GH36-type glycosyl hydrolase domain-containing protein n=1 Tax=Thalassotalea atypica TaxID=2054316 RepID=UPI002573B547|nr:NdvB protein [Thalassotalea atypica]